jgi:ketosteroid isomerase-like protein
MSQENVEIVRRGVEAYATADVETMLEVADPEIEWKQAEEPSPVRGYEGVARAMVRWNEMWDDPSIEAEEFLDGGDRIVVVIRHRGRGKASGVETDMASYHLFTVRGGRIVSMHEYGPGKRAEALEAAGLSEQELRNPSENRRG